LFNTNCHIEHHLNENIFSFKVDYKALRNAFKPTNSIVVNDFVVLILKRVQDCIDFSMGKSIQKGVELFSFTP
jgi:hypothetical protein